jgi:predicted dehydrogenase
MLVPELEEFAAAIIDHRQPSITAADGRRVLKVLDAVKDSSLSGQPVKFCTSN